MGKKSTKKSPAYGRGFKPKFSVIKIIWEQCNAIIKSEGGENKSELAKQAKALKLLVDGVEANKECINPIENAIYSMEQFNFSNLKEAASYARIRLRWGYSPIRMIFSST